MKQIFQILPNTEYICHASSTIITEPIKRKYWDLAEDEHLNTLVNKYGMNNWALISSQFNLKFKQHNRNGKQCRERYLNHLYPKISNDIWSEKEEIILFAKHMEYGNKWAKINKFLPNRTLNSIKNHFYSKFRKFLRSALNILEREGLVEKKLNCEKLYKKIKRSNIPYKSLSKEKILEIIKNSSIELEISAIKKKEKFIR